MLINCYSMGNVTGGNNASVIGGFAGDLNGARNCYSTGTVAAAAAQAVLADLREAILFMVLFRVIYLSDSGPNNGLGTPLTDLR